MYIYLINVFTPCNVAGVPMFLCRAVKKKLGVFCGELYVAFLFNPLLESQPKEYQENVRIESII